MILADPLAARGIAEERGEGVRLQQESGDLV